MAAAGLEDLQVLEEQVVVEPVQLAETQAQPILAAAVEAMHIPQALGMVVTEEKDSSL